MPPRAKIHKNCANPEWVGWLVETADKIEAGGRSSVHHTYRKAASSLAKHPVRLENPSDCLCLSGFGPKLVDFIEKRRASDAGPTGSEAGARQNASTAAHPVASEQRTVASDSIVPERAPPVRPAPAKRRSYIPKEGSRPYAVLLGMYDATAYDGLYADKSDLVSYEKKYFSGADSNGHNAALRLLIDKDLVARKDSNNSLFSLTEAGFALAMRMRTVSGVHSSPVRETAGRSSPAGDESPSTGLRGPSRDMRPPSHNMTSPRPGSAVLGSALATPGGPPATPRAPPDSTPDRAFVLAQGAPLKAHYAKPSRSLNVLRHPLHPAPRPAPTVPPVETTILKRGSFDIVLALDMRERASAADNAEIVQMLERSGVSVETRSLALGDITWIARPHDRTASDIVLDFVVERKRLDDLCLSVYDGRYVNQKLRLVHSGLSQRFYLVEAFGGGRWTGGKGGATAGTADHNAPREVARDSIYKQISTTKSQLQAVDGFFVHETASIADSVRFLARLNVIVHETYANSDLHVIPDRNIARDSYLSLRATLAARHPHRRYHTSYAAYEKLNAKNAFNSVGTQYAAMLQCIHGMSAEKACQVMERWPTPRALYDGCMQREGEDEGPDDGRGIEKNETSNRLAGSKRKAEDYIVEQLDGEMQRGVKRQLGAKIFKFVTALQYE